MGPGFFYYHRGPDGPQIRRALLLLAISGLLAFALYAGAQMRPLLGSLATTRVSNAVNRIVYQAVNEAIDSGQIAYEQLVSYEKDNEGRITMVRSNMAAFNHLQAEILDPVLTRVDQGIVHPGGQSDRFTPAGGPGTSDLRADGVGGVLVGPV